MNEDDNIEYTRILYTHPEGEYEWRFVISSFRGTQYLQIRKYFLSFEDGMVPSKDGASIPISIELVQNLLIALKQNLSQSEFAELSK